jgi:hypothetical protein
MCPKAKKVEAPPRNHVLIGFGIIKTNLGFHYIPPILGHGGVRQYLHRIFHDPTTREADLSKVLYDLVPADQSVDYLMDYPFPACFPGP